MTPTSRKQQWRSKAKWLVRVILVNDSEHSFTLNTEDIKLHIQESDNDIEHNGSSAGIINKYVFPCVVKRFEYQPFKSIKIRGNYEQTT
jgi:hypothetical protein